MSELTNIDRQIALFAVLDSWNPSRRVEKVAFHFCISNTRAQRLLDRPAFQSEVERLRRIYAGQGPGSTVAEAKQRVGDLDKLYCRVPAAESHCGFGFCPASA